MIRITDSLWILPSELEERFVRASGPGGQNVNKVSTAVELRFHVDNSVCLTDAIKTRLKALAGRRLTQDGVLVIFCQEHRTQDLNRQGALERLAALLEKASAPPPPPRKATRPTRSSVQRRLTGKSIRAQIKTGRGKVEFED